MFTSDPAAATKRPTLQRPRAMPARVERRVEAAVGIEERHRDGALPEFRPDGVGRDAGGDDLAAGAECDGERLRGASERDEDPAAVAECRIE